MKRVLLGLAVGAIGYCALAVLHFPAVAQGVQVGTGVICDKASQVEAVGALFAKNGNQGAIEAVNEKEKDACGILTVAYVEVKTISTIPVAGKMYRVVEISVVAIASAGQWQKLTSPLVQFTAIETEERPA